MMTIRMAIAVLVTVGLAAAPLAAEAKKHKHVRHYIPTAAYSEMPVTNSGVSVPRSGTYGTSGTPIGTVTAPSIGSYNWPSVGVTNAVPTWNNTNPPVR
jgi:hypothetical protein